MTVNYKKIYQDLRKNKTHSPPCDCAACFYPRYLKKSKSIRGRKFDKQSFFVWWLMFELKKSYLIKKKKGELINIFGKTFFNAKESDFERAPFMNEMKRILRQLPECDEFFYPEVKTYFIYIKQYLDRWSTNESFLKLHQEIETEILWDSRKSQQGSNKKKFNNEDIIFAQKVSDHIQKKGRIKQRELLRHFSAKRESELRKIWGILKHNYAIDIQKQDKKKTIYYCPKVKTKGLFFKVGV